jgi:TctA family transporter
VALRIRAPEYTSVIILALASVAMLSGKSALNTMGMGVLGLMLGTVGPDLNSGITRFTFGMIQLQDGISFIPVALALFALVDITFVLSEPERRLQIKTKLSELMPNWADIKACIAPILRGTAIGGAFGILPGTGPMISSFTAYAVEKRVARNPERFGKGAIEGVASPEAAANAAAFTHFIPMPSLGIPAGAVMALLFGAMLIQGVTPGPQMITSHPDIFWGLVASMWIGNLMLLVLNLPLVGIWIKMLETPYRFLYPLIVVFCMVGVFSERREVFDIFICAGVLLVGWVLERLDCSPAPLILGMILGPLLEENFRRSLLLSRGDPTIFLTRPISAFFLLLAVVVIIVFTLPGLKKKEESVMAAGGEKD